MKIVLRRRPRIVALLVLVWSIMAAGTYITSLQTQSSAGTGSVHNTDTKRAAEHVPEDVPQSPAASTPSSNNYTFTTSTSGTFTDMSSGATQLVAADRDDAASSVQTLPFDFFLMGQRFNQFSATSNGMLGLGSTAISSAVYTLYSGSASAPTISAFGGDLGTGAAGSVRYKITGTEPDRVLTVEFSNMSLLKVSAPGSNDGTYQVRIYETTGQIEFVYGPMTRNSGTGALNGQQVGIGWATANSTNSLISITSTTNLASTTAPFGQALYAVGPIANLNSPVEGARRTYSMLPPVPTAPTNLTFSAVTPTSIDLNWADSPDEVRYAIYRSTDGAAYSYFGAAASDATTFSATGLTPSTPYWWKVYAVSEGAPSASAASGSQATPPAGNIVSTLAGGPWSAPATWVGGIVPTSNDNVTIADGSTVTIDPASTPVAYSLTVGQGASGTLEFNTTTARTLTIVQSLTVAPGGTFRTGAATGVTTHIVSVGQDVTNNGTIDFSTTTTNAAGAGFIFTGGSDATFTNNGSLDLRNTVSGNGGLHLNKGSGQAAILDFVQNSAANVTTQGGTAAGFLTIANGTFQLSGSAAFTNPLFKDPAYTIASTAAFRLSNPSATVLGQNGSPTNAGLLRISAGTFNVGTASGNSMGASAGAQFLIEGGVTNIASRFLTSAAVTYTQSGGTLNVDTVANGSSSSASFGLTGASAVMNMSGGTIVLVQRSTGGTPLDYNMLGTLNYTGGTLQVGNGATNTNFDFRVKGPMPALLVDNTANPKSVLLTAQSTIDGNLTLNTGTSLNLSGFLCSIAGATLTNNGTIVNTTAGGRFDITGSAPQTYTGSGIMTPGSLNIELDNPSGLTIDPASPALNVLRLNLWRGTITNAYKITLGTAGASSATIQIGIAGATGPGGSLDSSPTFNPGSAGVILIYAQETLSRTTGFEVPPARLVQSLTLANTNGVALAGGNLTINGNLTLSAGNLTTAANTMIMGNSATVTRTGGHVIGNLRKTFTAPSSKTFEVGTDNGYSPVTVNVTAGTYPATFTARATQATMPSLFDPSRSLARYWTLAATGLTADLTFNYLDPNDIPATANEGNFVIFKYDGTLTAPGGTVNTTANQATITGVSTFSDWSLAEPAAANTPTRTPTAADTSTPSPSDTSTPSETPTTTATDTATSTPTLTGTPTDLPTLTPTVTPSDTSTSTETPTGTPTNTNTATATPTDVPNTDTPTETATVTSLPTDTPTETATESPTVTPSPTPTDSPTHTAAPTLTPTVTPSETATLTPTNTNTATATPTDVPNTNTPTETPSNSPTATSTATETPTDTNTPSATSTSSPTATDTITSTATSTITPSETPTETNTTTPTYTPTLTPTSTPTSSNTATPTASSTPMPSNTPTNSPTNTSTPSNTATTTPTSTPTDTSTPTPSSTPTNTSTHTNTPTNTATHTPSATPTNTSTPTDSPTVTPTSTSTASRTPTSTPSTTPTNTDTSTPTNSATNTPSDTPTVTQTSSPTSTPTDTPTDMPTGTPTDTVTSTATNTSTSTLTPTLTVPTSTDTVTATRTSTLTHTPTPTQVFTSSPTSTPTDTTVPTDTPTDVPTSTDTGTPAATPTACELPFVDVTASDWFYEYVQYLYCHGVINGYVTEPPCNGGTPCFKPENPTTRGQLAKIVVLAFAFQIDVSAGPSFEDVAVGSTFYPYIETAKSLGLISGYECGRLGEPCDPYNRPYYHPERNVTRGQITKIVVSSAIVADQINWTLLDPAEGTFQDVAPGSTFFRHVETGAAHGIINGYPCGAVPAGVCVPPDNKPYFLANVDATRAQISKIVYLAATSSPRR